MEKGRIILIVLVLLTTIQAATATNTTEFNEYMKNYNSWKGGNTEVQEVKTVDEILQEREFGTETVSITEATQEITSMMDSQIHLLIMFTVMGFITWSITKGFRRSLF